MIMIRKVLIAACLVAACSGDPGAPAGPQQPRVVPLRILSVFTGGPNEALPPEWASFLAAAERGVPGAPIRFRGPRGVAPSNQGPIALSTTDDPPPGIVAILGAQSQVGAWADAQLVARTQYRGSRARHSYNITASDDQNEFSIPSSSAAPEGQGYATGGFLAHEFVSIIWMQLPRNCGITVSQTVNHYAWMPGFAFAGEDHEISYDSRYNGQCAPPPDEEQCEEDDGQMDELRAPFGGSSSPVGRSSSKDHANVPMTTSNSCDGGGGGGGGGSGGAGGSGGGSCTTQWGTIEVSYDGGQTWEVWWSGYYTECAE